MPRKSPSHVSELIESKSQFNSDHPIELAFFELITTGTCLFPDVEEAYEIFQEEQTRHIVNAAILAKASDELLLKLLDIPIVVTAAYRHLFFDRNVFRHALDAAIYVTKLEVADSVKEIYELAIQQGADVLLSKYRIGPADDLDPKFVIRQMLHTFYERAQSHRGHQITSDQAKEAFKWARESVSTAATLIDKGNNQAEAALKDLRLTLEIKDYTKKPEDIGISLDDIEDGTS